MQHEPNPYEEPPSPRKISRLALGAGVAAIVVVAGAGIAFAVSGPSKTSPASSDPTTSKAAPTSTLPPGPHGKGPHRFFGPAFGPALGGPGLRGGGRVLHGDYTIQTPSGHQEILVQSGTVQAVSSTSITLLSTDGYSHTYAVVPSTVVDAEANGIGTVQNKDQVQLQATVQNGKDTATNIVDITKIGSSRKGFGFAGPPNQPAPAESGAGTAAI